MVADIIEAAQNLHENVPIGWAGEKQTVEPMAKTAFRYFVRVAGSLRNHEQDIKELFGNVEVIELYGMDEFAILTREMEDGAFAQAAQEYNERAKNRSEYGIKQMIRAML